MVCYSSTDKVLTDKHLEKYNRMVEWKKKIINREEKWDIQDLPKIFEDVLDCVNNVDDVTEEMYEYFARYVTEDVILRNLAGTGFKTTYAKLWILRQVQYRYMYNIDDITPDRVENGIKLNVMYSLNRVSKEGYPISYMLIPKEIPSNDIYKHIIAAFIWTIEKSIRIGELNNKRQGYWIYDLSNLSFFGLPDLGITKQLINISNEYYPDLAYKTYMLFAPKSFRFCWKLISGLLTEEQKSKLHFLSDSESKSYTTYKDEMFKSDVLKICGGELEAKYSYDWELEEYNKYAGYTNLAGSKLER